MTDSLAEALGLFHNTEITVTTTVTTVFWGFLFAAFAQISEKKLIFPQKIVQFSCRIYFQIHVNKRETLMALLSVFVWVNIRITWSLQMTILSAS